MKKCLTLSCYAVIYSMEHNFYALTPQSANQKTGMGGVPSRLPSILHHGNGAVKRKNENGEKKKSAEI